MPFLRIFSFKEWLLYGLPGWKKKHADSLKATSLICIIVNSLEKKLGGKGETCFVFYLSSPLFAYKTKFKGNTYKLGYMAQQQVFRFSKEELVQFFTKY